MATLPETGDWGPVESFIAEHAAGTARARIVALAEKAHSAGLWCRGSASRRTDGTTLTLTWWLPAEVHEIGTIAEAYRQQERVSMSWDIGISSVWRRGRLWRSPRSGRLVGLADDRQVRSYKDCGEVFDWFAGQARAQAEALARFESRAA